MKGPRIDIPWYNRQIFARLGNDLADSQPINFNRPRGNSNNPNPQPELSPEPVPQVAPQPEPNSTNNPAPSPDGTKIVPIELPGTIPQFPSEQPFPVPKGTPVIVPRTKPAAKPNKAPGRTIPFPRRNPGRTPARTPAAAIDLLSPLEVWEEYQQKPWEIIPVGGLTPVDNSINTRWIDPIVGYANDIGVDAQQFSQYMISYDYTKFSVSGMYSDLSGMYGKVAAAILIGYIIASIPLGVPGVPGV